MKDELLLGRLLLGLLCSRLGGTVTLSLGRGLLALHLLSNRDLALFIQVEQLGNVLAEER